MKKIIQPASPRTAICPLHHSWPVTWEIINTGMVRREGLRAYEKIVHVVEPHHCPRCHNQWSRLDLPAAAGEAEIVQG